MTDFLLLVLFSFCFLKLSMILFLLSMSILSMYSLIVSPGLRTNMAARPVTGGVAPDATPPDLLGSVSFTDASE